MYLVPELYTIDIKELEEKTKYLNSLNLTKENIVKCPKLYQISKEKIEEIENYFISLNFTKEEISKIAIKWETFFTYPLEEIKKLVHNYDIAYYNQETILGGKEYGLSNRKEASIPCTN